MAAINGFNTTAPDARYGDGDSNPYCRAQRFTAGGTGTKEITQIGFWGGAAVAGKKLRLAIFTHDAVSNKPDALVANSTSDEVNLPTGASLVSFTYVTKPQVTGGTLYWLVLYTDAGGNGYIARFATGGTTVYVSSAFTYPNVPTGDGWHTATTSAVDTSLFAVYSDSSVAPTVTTQAVTDLADTTATGHGTVVNDGGATVTDRGVCWAETPMPRLAGSHAHAVAGGTGAFTADLTGLTPGTHYYVAAFATNSEGTAYGADVEINVATSGTFLAAWAQGSNVILQ